MYRDDDGDEGEDDFIALFESVLEGEIDFSLQLEKELENDLFSAATLLSNSASVFVDPSPVLFNDDDDDEEFDAATNRPPTKRVRGKCLEGYEFGDLFES